MSDSRILRPDWLAEPGLQRLLEVLSADGDEARIAGGAVRNAMLGEDVADVDIATTTTPDVTIARARAAGFKTVPTGIEHGTVTVIVDGQPYEVTTLRADVETDGRHAVVKFSRDWRSDAERRDFTINGMFLTAAGEVVDLVGGVADLEKRLIRFIGDAGQRIEEDYLRILRFFRFFAWYGLGRPDAEGLKASARLKPGLDRLSPERVWAELRKLLSAPDPSRALLWMRQASVLTQVLPESEKWGIDAIHGLVEAERKNRWPADPMLRLMAMVPPDADRLAAMAARLKMSNADAARLDGFARATPPKADTDKRELAKIGYRGDVQGIKDRLRLAAASGRDEGQYLSQLKFLSGWQKPAMPVSGADLLALGMKAGPEMGKRLAALENLWVESDFRLGRDELLAKAGD